MKLSPAELHYVLLQRTKYIDYPAIERQFTEDMEGIYENIKPYLPSPLNSVLDVGCGIGGVDALIGKDHPETQLTMLDANETDDEIYYGFEKDGSYYNSLGLTRSFLESNGVAPDKILMVIPLYKEEAFAQRPDLILSFLSWGFHYPVSTYLTDAYYALRDGGRLILDVRKGTGGEREIETKFGNLIVLEDCGKYQRVMAEKKV